MAGRGPIGVMTAPPGRRGGAVVAVEPAAGPPQGTVFPLLDAALQPQHRSKVFSYSTRRRPGRGEYKQATRHSLPDRFGWSFDAGKLATESRKKSDLEIQKKG